MPNIKSDVGVVAEAIKEFFSYLKIRLEGKEVRNLKSDANYAMKYMRRVEKEFPKAKHDRTLKKYKKKFQEDII